MFLEEFPHASPAPERRSLLGQDRAGLVRGNAPGDPKPSYTGIVLRAISLALRDHPDMNRLVLRGVYRHQPVQLHAVDAVVAVERVLDGEDVVYAGILRDTDRRSSAAITRDLRRLAEARADTDERLGMVMRLVRLVPGLLARWIIGLPRFAPGLWRKHRGGAFALTTVGKYGVDSIAARWPWPLTFTYGEVTERPVVVAGQLAVRNSLYLSMGFNRRLCNGAPAARFFHDIVRRLEEADLEETTSTAVGTRATRVPNHSAFRGMTS